MRLYHKPMSSDLAILNAEHFIGADDIVVAGKTGKVEKVRRMSTVDSSRKRAKKSAVDTVMEVEAEDYDADEKSKRARGRPRLDTTDQNAADRRRTQIRLAQRAYRSRKESAIQTLEKEVESLQETKEEMRNAFMKLHDYAVSHGILEILPEFAQELRSTTEKFLMLARKSSEIGGDNSEAASPELELRVSGKPSQRQTDQSSSSEAVEDAPPVTNVNNSVWGYTFTAESQMDPALTMSDLSLPLVTQTSLGYDTSAMPSLDTPAFNFETPSLESFFSQPTPPPSALTTTTPTITPPSITPFLSALPLPSTMAFTETTFGRRLQRSTLETGYQLLTMANPPPTRYAQAFGFCLLFESIDKVRARFRHCLEKSRRESLHDWRSPFWALGGTGQRHQAATTSRGSVVGNQGAADVAKHGFGTDFGLGPFNAKTAETRERRLGPGMRIVLPGFEGEFFDPDEVEVYLQGRGVRIRPGDDYVTAEVDVAWFDRGADMENVAYDAWAAEMSPPVSVDRATGWAEEDVFGNARTAEGLPALNGARKKLVTVDVAVLIRELVERGVCLGRSPGYRPKDVDEAFWTAARSASIMNF